ncbi:MAG: TatD family hydrolase [Actinomycetota bacterium]
MLVDAHCHLDMLEDLDAVLDRMRAAGVERAVTIGVDSASSEWAARAATDHAELWATVGLHPHDAKDRTDELMARLEELAAQPRVVAIGEAGLDYHYDNSPRDIQRAVFTEQIQMALRARTALVIHTRDAWDDTFAILEREGVPERTVFHCWSGDAGHAQRAVEMGAILSFSGTVTFKNAGDLREAAHATPLAKIVVETDAPFLTPQPHRGKRNEPAFVRHVADAIASLKGVPSAEADRALSANAARLFAWDPS